MRVPVFRPVSRELPLRSKKTEDSARQQPYCGNLMRPPSWSNGFALSVFYRTSNKKNFFAAALCVTDERKTWLCVWTSTS
jgi:hypothetical protein